MVSFIILLVFFPIFLYNLSLVCVLIKKKPCIHETIEQQQKIYTFIMIVLSSRNATLAQPKKKMFTQNKRTELNKRQKNDYTKLIWCERKQVMKNN